MYRVTASDSLSGLNTLSTFDDMPNNPAITITQPIRSDKMNMPDSANAEPHYVPVVNELLRQFGDQIQAKRQRRELINFLIYVR